MVNPIPTSINSLVHLALLLLIAGCKGPTLNEYIADTPKEGAATTIALESDATLPSVAMLEVQTATATSTAASTGVTTETATAEIKGTPANEPTSANATLEAIPPTSTSVNTPSPAPTATRRPPLRNSRPTANPAALGAAVAKINIPSLSIRRFPLEDAPVVGAVREGQEYGVSALSRDGKWVRLETPVSVGGRGWVAARFISVYGEITGILITDGYDAGYNSSTLASDQAVANTGTQRLRIRNGPASSYETIFFAFNGELFIMQELSADGAWVRLSNPSIAVDGWASRSLVRLATDPIPTPRPTPTSTPTVLLTPPTARPTVLRPTRTPTMTMTPTSPADGSQSASNRIDAAPTNTDAVPIANTPAAVTSTTIPTDGGSRVEIVTDGSRLRVRSAPQLDADIIARIQNGDSYQVLDTSSNGEWIHILLEGVDTTTDQSSGWISREFTRSAVPSTP